MLCFGTAAAHVRGVCRAVATGFYFIFLVALAWPDMRAENALRLFFVLCAFFDGQSTKR